MIIWVAPNGNDSWSGRKPTGSGAFGPKQTLAAAVELARETPGNDTIMLAKGDYYVPQALKLDSRDNGLTITAGKGASPALHGGINLSTATWESVGNGIYATRIDPAQAPRGVFDLHVNGDRQTLARFPNGDLSDLKSGWLFPTSDTLGDRELKFQPGTIPRFSDTKSLQVLSYGINQWSTNIAKVSTIDYDRGVITLADNPPWHYLGPESRFFLLNSRDLIDSGKEWFYDKSSSTLFFKPDNPSVLGQANIVAATTESIFELSNASDITISKLALRDLSFYGSNEGEPDYSNAGGAIRIVGGSRINLTDNVIENAGVGITGLDLTDSSILRNRIEDITGNGIKIGTAHLGSGSSRVLIADNVIRDVGELFVNTGAITVHATRDAVIRGNLIDGATQMGIYVVQIESSGTDAVTNLLVEYNVIRNTNLGSSDGGAFKSVAKVPGGVRDIIVQDNWIDRVDTLRFHGDGRIFPKEDWTPDDWPVPLAAGLYLDINTINAQVLRNIVTDSHGGIHVTNSENNVFNDNIIYQGTSAGIQVDNLDLRFLGHGVAKANTFNDNVIVRDHPSSTGIKVFSQYEEPDVARFSNNTFHGAAIDGNAFSIIDGAATKLGNFAKYQESPLVLGDRLAEPGFVDPAKLDFRLRADSPLKGTGFDAPNATLLARMQDALDGVIAPIGSKPGKNKPKGGGGKRKNLNETSGSDSSDDTPKTSGNDDGGSKGGDKGSKGEDADPGPALRVADVLSETSDSVAMYRDSGGQSWSGLHLDTLLTRFDILS